MSYLSVICLLHKGMPLSQLRRRALAPHCSVGLFTDKWDPMFNLTDLLDQLGAHFPLVVIACIELLAAALLVARAVRSEDNRPVGGRRSAVGKAGENSAEMLRALNFRRFEANLLLRRADPMRRAGMIEHQLFALLQAEEIDSTLGYETKAVDARVAEKFEKVKPGEFARTCALLERCVYGGQAPDAREERALSSFLWKLIRSWPKHTLLQNLKRRYRRI